MLQVFFFTAVQFQLYIPHRLLLDQSQTPEEKKNKVLQSCSHCSNFCFGTQDTYCDSGFRPTFEYAGRVMFRLQIALWLRLRYVRGSLVKDKRPHGSCAVSLICSTISLITWCIVSLRNFHLFWQSYFNKERQSVLFEGKEAEHMVLSTLGERYQVSKAVGINGLSLQDLWAWTWQFIKE